MGGFLVFILVFVIILAVIILGLARIYNRLVVLKNRYINAYSQIDVQLKRRYDLIPNLVESCRAYLAHEATTLEAVTQARNIASNALSSAAGDPTQQAAIKKLAESDSALTGVLGRFLMVAEAYPELKANQTISDLMEDLRHTENRISFSRQAFNDSVMEYNQSREVFPAVLFVNLFGFKGAELWYLSDKAEADPLRIKIDNKQSNP
ncbi:MAG: LemA family protein [Deltaproteobacteria bacterium]|jgi:LemA protein|nr:LemA family protein [Deltaproteobacteria bacterium]